MGPRHDAALWSPGELNGTDAESLLHDFESLEVR